MQQPWSLGRVLALITVLLGVGLLFLIPLVPIGAVHLLQLTLILLVALALSVVLVSGPP